MSLSPIATAPISSWRTTSVRAVKSPCPARVIVSRMFPIGRWMSVRPSQSTSRVRTMMAAGVNQSVTLPALGPQLSE